MTASTPEQQRLGQICVTHADMVQAMLSGGDVSGAEDYLKKIRVVEGVQMEKNVTDLISLRLAILPPDML